MSKEYKKDNWLTAQQLLEMEIVEVPKLWSPFLPKKGLAMLTGSSDCGKSILLRMLALNIVMGNDEFLGYPLYPEASVVLYVSSEDEPDSLSSWFNKNIGKVEKEQTAYLENLHFLCTDINDLTYAIDDKLAETPADMVVIDAWADGFLGNTNNLVDVRQNLNELKNLASKHNCLFLLLHHTVKNSDKNNPDKSKLNGSGAIEQKVRSLLELRKGNQPGERFLSVLKNNYMSDKMKEESLKLSFDEERLELVNTGEKHVFQSDRRFEGQTKYDPTVWVPRMNEIRNESGLSYQDVHNILIKMHPDETVPGITWFKEHCK